MTNDLPLDNLNPAQRKAFQTHLNDLYDDYQEQLSNLIIEAKTMVPNSLYDEGDPQANARAMLEDYARQANIISQDYYRGVRSAWAEATGASLPAYKDAQVSSDRAAWQIFGGYNDSDFMGLKFKDVVNGRARSGMTMDDLWARKTAGWDDGDWAELAHDLINTTARLTNRLTAENDPSKPRYARVPHGRTCAFCTPCSPHAASPTGARKAPEDAATATTTTATAASCPAGEAANLKDTIRMRFTRCGKIASLQLEMAIGMKRSDSCADCMRISSMMV